jgi:ATP-dependent Clp protease adaptor protein ClpS
MTDTLTTPDLQMREDQKTKRQPPYNVVLLNDDDHTFQYVIAMMQELFGYPPERGKQIADEVHNTGRAIVLTTTKEHAELKQDQIHAYGPDPWSSKDCKGSMTAIIEPAPG